MKNKKLVIFDFDGVLVNTLERAYEIHKNLNQTLTWKRFQDFSNGNFIDGMYKAVNEENYIIPKDFFEHYEDHLTKVNIHDVLHETVLYFAKNYIVSIVSSTRSSSIQSFLKKEKLDGHIADVLGMDVHANKTTKINMLLEKYSLSSKDSVIVTDTLGDILEANVCNVASIGVLWGLHGKETLEKGNPAKIIDNPLLLVDSVKEILD